MIIKADLHNHLRTGSSFEDADFNKTVDTANKRLGENGVFGLINFNDKRYESFVKLRGYERQNLGNAIYIPEKKILIVKGQEIPTKQGHMLVLGIKEGKYLKWNASLEDSVKEAKDNNGIIIADHPFFREGLGDCLIRNIGYFDGMEIFNGECVGIPGLTPFKANERALAFFREIKKQGSNIGGIATSDGHSFYELGKCYSALNQLETKTPEALVSSLKREIQNSDSTNSHGETSLVGLIDHIIDLGYSVAKSKLPF